MPELILKQDTDSISCPFQMKSLQIDEDKLIVERLVYGPAMYAEWEHDGEYQSQYYLIDLDKGTQYRLTEKDEKFLRSLKLDKLGKIFIWRVLSELGCVKHRVREN